MNYGRFHGVVKRFHKSIVGHFPWSIHALHETQFCQSFSESICHILDTTITVKDYAWPWSTIMDRPVQCPKGECCCSIATQRPTNNPPRILVHYGRQKSPVLAYFQVRDITNLDLIRALGKHIQRSVGNVGKEGVCSRI